MRPSDVDRPPAAPRAMLRDADFRLLVTNVEDYAIFLLDRDGRVRSWNRGAERIKGWSADEIIGEHFSRFYPEEDLRDGKPARELAEAATHGRFEDEGWRLRKDGGRFWANVVITALRDESGQLRGFAKVTRDLTERRRAEVYLVEERLRRARAEAAGAALRQSRDELAAILRNISEGIVAFDQDARPLYANQRAAQLAGYPSTEAFLRAFPNDILRELDIRDELGRALSPDERPIERALHEARVVEVTLRVRLTRRAQPRIIAVAAIPVLDAQGVPTMAIATLRDITEERHADEVAHFLAEMGATLSSSLDYAKTLQTVAHLAVPALADWVVVDITRDGTPEHLERVALAHFDPEKERRGLELSHRYPPQPDAPAGIAHVVRTRQPELVREITEETLAQSNVGAEDRAVLHELGLRSAMTVPLVAGDRVHGAITFVSAESGRHYDVNDLDFALEIARRAALAIENARLYASAQEAARRAEEAMHARESFLSVASHELKTPLTTMMLQAQTLRRALAGETEVPRARLAARAEKLVGQVERLNDLVVELLDVSRLAAGRIDLRWERFALADVAREVVARFREAGERAPPIEIEVRDAAEGEWDRLRVDQVVTNLVSNALKYGGGKPVDVTVEADGHVARLRVRDRGIGIAPDDKERLFERFTRLVTDRAIGGFGLGLWIVRQIVDSFGGDIVVDSTPGEGSTFTVELPRARPPSSPPDAGS